MNVNIEDYIREISNFPKEGVNFKDLTPLLNNPKIMNHCLNELKNLVGNQHIDKVVAMESRGFFFGSLLAQAFGAGFIPVRKPGKLPYKTIKESYALEYGEDALEIHADAIIKGEKVLIHDDVLATGGTAKAVCKLVERLGGEIVQCNFIMELTYLNGRKQLQGQEIATLLSY